ncbi:hypothetical protein ACROYT_G036073 [Oculina patagonica]
MKTAEEVANETDPKASISSTSPVSRLQSDFSSKLDTVKHQATNLARTKENMEGKTLSKDIDIILKEKALPPPKARNPKRAFTINMSKTQGSSPPALASCAVPRPVRNQNTMKRSTRHSRKTEDGNLDRIIDEILDTDSDASGRDLSNVGTSLTKNSAREIKQSEDTEEINLEEAINDILEIPELGTDSKQVTKLGCMTKERKTKPRKNSTACESRDVDTKSLTAHILGDTDVPDVKSPDARASYPTIET